MQQYSGKSVYKGITMGPVAVLEKQDDLVRRRKIDDPEQEIERTGAACEQAKDQLGKLYDKAVKEVGETSSVRIILWMDSR